MGTSSSGNTDGWRSSRQRRVVQQDGSLDSNEPLKSKLWLSQGNNTLGQCSNGKVELYGKVAARQLHELRLGVSNSSPHSGNTTPTLLCRFPLFGFGSKATARLLRAPARRLCSTALHDSKVVHAPAPVTVLRSSGELRLWDGDSSEAWVQLTAARNGLPQLDPSSRLCGNNFSLANSRNFHRQLHGDGKGCLFSGGLATRLQASGLQATPRRHMVRRPCRALLPLFTTLQRDFDAAILRQLRRGKRTMVGRQKGSPTVKSLSGSDFIRLLYNRARKFDNSCLNN